MTQSSIKSDFALLLTYPFLVHLFWGWEKKVYISLDSHKNEPHDVIVQKYNTYVSNMIYI